MHVATQSGGDEWRVAVRIRKVYVHEWIFAQQLHYAVVPQTRRNVQGGRRLIDRRGLHVQIVCVLADVLEGEDGVFLRGKAICGLLRRLFLGLDE